MTDLDLQLREMQPGDRNYILSSWLRSYAKAREFRGMTRGSYFRMYTPHVESMLARSTVAIATLPEAPSAVLGWMAIEGDYLHYVHTKPTWRSRIELDTRRQPVMVDGRAKIETRIGVASYLLRDLIGLPVKYTHEPPWWASVPPTWTYVPEARFPREAAA